MLRKAAGNTIIYGIGPQIPKFAGVLILPLITPYLTPTDFGIFGVIQAYSLALSYLKTLGTDIVLTNVFFKHPHRYPVVWRTIAGLLHFWALALAIGFGFIITTVLGKDHPFLLETILLNTIPLAFFTTTENQFLKYYQLQQRPWPITIRVIVTGMINVLVTYYTIAVLQLGYRGWFYATFTASMVSFLWIIYPIYIRHNFRPVFIFRWHFIKRVLKVSLPLLPHYYGNYLLSSSDRVVLDLLKVSDAGIGRYNAAYLFANYFNILGNSAKKAIAPMLQSYYVRGMWGNVSRLIFYWQTAFLLATTAASIWVKEIVPFFIRVPGMEGIYGMAIWLIMATNYIPMYSASTSLLFFFEETRRLWLRAIVAFAISVIINLIFVPIYGVYVAAISAYASYMYLGYSTFLMREYRAKRQVKFKALIWFVVTLSATFASILVVELDCMIKTIITIIASSVISVFISKILYQRRASRRVQ